MLRGGKQRPCEGNALRKMPQAAIFIDSFCRFQAPPHESSKSEGAEGLWASREKRFSTRSVA
jgi:hypothetical protein